MAVTKSNDQLAFVELTRAKQSNRNILDGQLEIGSRKVR